MSTADDLRENILDEFRKTADSDRVYPTDDPWPVGVLGNRGDPNIVLALPLAEALANVFSGEVGTRSQITTHYRYREVVNTAKGNRIELWIEFSLTPNVEESWKRVGYYAP